MRTIFRTTARWILSLNLAACAAMPVLAEALPVVPENPVVASRRATGELTWIAMAPNPPASPVQLWFAGQPMAAGGECFVITHGMGGTVSGDRFHQLAVAIQQRFPRACVLRIDWSPWASASFAGFSSPWEVARRIDKVGDQAAAVLRDECLDPARTTFIGESFGNWVNARIAHQLGGVRGILALNPAHEAGGYAPPDLRKLAQRTWSFHTYSVFDTTLQIAANDFWLQTPLRSSPGEQHVAGIRWLSARLETNDTSWLQMDKTLPPRRAGQFQALVTVEGEVLEQQPSRERPVPAEDDNSPTSPLVTDVAASAP